MKKNAKPNKNSLFLKNKKNAVRLNQEGLRLILLGKTEDAINCFEKSIKKSFNFPDPYFHLGNYYFQTNNHEKAEKYYLNAIKIDQNNADFFFNLGILKYSKGLIDEATNLYKKCLDIDPSYTKSLKYLGNIYKDKKEFRRALENNKQWKDFDPDNPEPYFNDALIHIRNGRFDLGWKLYERGLENNIRDPFKGYYNENKSIWDGKIFDGVLLVYGEQGLGDQIIFGTVLPELLKDQKNVILKVDARLKNLFQYSFSNLKIYGEHEDIPDHTYDKYISIGSLCKFYRNHTDDFMNSTFKAYTFKKKLPLNFKNQISKLTNLKIGISWKTFATKNDKKRSLTPLEVSTILRNNKNSFINLQYGEVNNEIEEINQLTNNKLVTIRDLDLTQDLNNVISLIKECDLIITIDNTIAHLSSSLGKITWILLPYSADFRWMEDITASLWYENAVLLRQTKNCNWKSVLDIINTALSGED